MYSEQASSLAEDANFYFFKRITLRVDQLTHTGRQPVGNRWPARLERSGVSRDSVKTKPNAFRDWWSLSGSNR